MDKIEDREVELWIRKFRENIEKKYSPQQIILFGSRARKEHLRTSDVDLIIVSEKFKSLNWIERIRKVAVEWPGLVGIEPLCYTPEEFEKKKREIGIVRQALKEGKILT